MIPPRLDRDIGMSVYSTTHPGCGGVIRSEPEGFRVEEVLSDFALSKIKEVSDVSGRLPTFDTASRDDRYAVYTLEKRGIDTGHALEGIRRLTGLKLKALGLKDAHATTRQYVCAMSKNRSIPRFKSDRVLLTRIGYTKRPLTKKDMVGNKFAITVSGRGVKLKSLKMSDHILNFYGYQRFGSRRAVTHLVGRAIIRRDFADAVDHILAYVSSHDDTDIRQSLSDSANYKQVLPRLPPGMDVERAVLEEMIRSGDPLTALRAVPIRIRRMYIQAYQAYLFNRTLSDAFSYGEDLFAPQDSDICYDNNNSLGRPGPGKRLAVPLVGYSYYKKTRFNFHISKILEQEGISYRDFFIKELQEISGEGGFREAAIRYQNFSISGDVVSFMLGRGSYATVLLREIIKPADPVSCGF